MDKQINVLSARVGEILQANESVLGVAESCTGGWLAKAITDIPGSSQWFDKGFVTYSNESKVELLGVSESILKTEGAVSEATVRAMAAGVLSYPKVNVAVAISGIAGPDGGSPEKPVGTVWFAWMKTNPAFIMTERKQFSGDRAAVRRAAVETALDGIIRVCEVRE